MCILRVWLVELLLDIPELLFGFIMGIPSIFGILNMLFSYFIQGIITFLYCKSIACLGTLWELVAPRAMAGWILSPCAPDTTTSYGNPAF